MPQIDKITFLTIVYWLFAFYFLVYLDLNVTYLYKFVTQFKLNLQRLIKIIFQIIKNNYLLRSFSYFYFLEKNNRIQLKFEE